MSKRAKTARSSRPAGKAGRTGKRAGAGKAAHAATGGRAGKTPRSAKPGRKPARPKAAATGRARGGAGKTPATAGRKTAVRAVGPRRSWLDDNALKPVIDRYARQLSSFIEAVADGVVEPREVEAQEARLVKLMQEVEPMLDDATHAKVTELLCELTAYDLMQVLCAMHAARPRTTFEG